MRFSIILRLNDSYTVAGLRGLYQWIVICEGESNNNLLITWQEKLKCWVVSISHRDYMCVMLLR